MRVVVDTNILVDYLQGVIQAREELARYQQAGISLITWMEILVGTREAQEEKIVRVFLSGFEMLSITDEVAEHAVALRRTYPIRLPDAIIWATARALNRLLVTRNTRDFPKDDPGIRVPYRL